MTPKFFVNTNVGYFGYDTFQVTDTQFYYRPSARVRCVEHVHRRAPGSTGCPFPEIPSSLQQLNGYADKPVSTRNVRDTFGRVGVNVDATYYANFKGQHTFKGGVQWERLSNDVLTGAQAPTVAINWNASRTTLDDSPRQVRGTYGYYTVARTYTEGKIHSNNVGLFIQDAWTISNRLTLNLGLRVGRGDIPSYQPRESRPLVRDSPTRSHRASASPTTSRAMGVGRLRQLGHVLRHQQARDAARRVGRRPLDQLPLHARHLRLAGDQLRGPGGFGLCRARSSSRRTAAMSRTTPPTTYRSESQADSDAGVHARRRSRADAIDVGRRPLRAQVDGPDDRRRRDPGGWRRRGVHDRQPRLWHRRVHAGGDLSGVSRPAGRQARLRRSRVPPAQAAVQPVVAEHQLHLQPPRRQLLRL